MDQINSFTGLEIAVIGMVGRFPGARDIHEFWQSLIRGAESITFFPLNGLAEDPGRIAARGIMEDIDCFDASFFDYTPLEAELMDPQVRIFHECAWEALEDAGYVPGEGNLEIGLFAGASSNHYWEALTALSGKSGTVGQWASVQLNDKDFLSGRVSFKLALTGPSHTLFTACSTSLVTVHSACQAVLNGECDIALAGGITVSLPQESGYVYQEGMVRSPDGHCRAFDSRAQGTVPGNGVGVVVLKRLEEAIVDRDYIYAVIKGSAVNNDGMRKVGFTAPSIEGQQQVIRTALRMAGIEAESIGYIETHGTGTTLGDPIEIEGLKAAFDTPKRGFCAIGAVKTNVGHLDIAAGIAGFIKTVLALRHRLIPPSLHFEAANLKIDFKNSPFYVNTRLKRWKKGKYPLRAGVSSFGIGGTNAHVILEEWPQGPGNHGTAQGALRQGEGKSPGYQLILLSAKTQSALDNMTQNLAKHLEKNPGIHLADAAYTLQVGRRAFKYRRILVSCTRSEVLRVLKSCDPEMLETAVSTGKSRPMVFLFPGQGAQYVNMGLGLYKAEEFFRHRLDECFDILAPLLGYDPRHIFYPGEAASATGGGGRGLDQTEIAQPLIFAIEYALAKLLIQWGIRPYAMSGHSIGEYTAACLSGVLSLEEALRMVVRRGKLMQQMPGGAMLSVMLGEENLRILLRDELAMAAVNGPSHCVVSGPHQAVDGFIRLLEEKGYQYRKIHTSHAFHSPMMDPILKTFEQEMGQVTLKEPKIPFISNLTGKWITFQDAQSPAYWARHIRGTVRFSDGLQQLLQEENLIFIEVGPGKVLSTFVRQQPGLGHESTVINLLRHPKEKIPDVSYLLNKIGKLWLYGKEIDWYKFHGRGKKQRVPLPPYPFKGKRFWPQGDTSGMAMEKALKNSFIGKNPDIADWFYIPSWERCPLRTDCPVGKRIPAVWLVFIDETGLGTRLAEYLEQEGEHVITVGCAVEFTRTGTGAYRMDPRESTHYEILFKELHQLGKIPAYIIHLWNVTGVGDAGPKLENIDRSQDLGLYSLLNIVQALGKEGISSEIKIGAVSNHMQEVMGKEVLCPEKATIMGAVKIIPLEYFNISCCSIDIILPPALSPQEDRLISLLLSEFSMPVFDRVIAYRGDYRWVQVVRPHRLDKTGEINRRLKERGVYLITGGLGGMGFTLAEYLAKRVKARLVLVGRSPFPPKEQWHHWLLKHEETDNVSLKIRKIQQMEEAGAEIMVIAANAANREQMQKIIARVEARFGKINGVLHTAGIADYEGVIQRRTREMTERILAPKMKGALVLDHILQGVELDFFVLFSSIGNFVYGIKFGQVGYNAANEFLDAFAYYKTGQGTFTTAINWADWKEVGMSVEAVKRKSTRGVKIANDESMRHEALTPAQGVEVFDRILQNSMPHVVISLKDLKSAMKRYNHLKVDDLRSDEEFAQVFFPGVLNQGTGHGFNYEPPRDEIQGRLAGTWERFLGIRSVGLHDNFFELGGDSLKAITLLSHIHREMKVRIPLAKFFETPTVKGLAEYLKGEGECRINPIKPVEKKEYHNTSSAQRRIYFQQQLDGDSTIYNLSHFALMEGESDWQRTGEICDRLVNRHDSFRTSIEVIQGQLVQRVYDVVELNVEYRHGGEEEIQALAKDFIRPFDLSRAPLSRIQVVEIGESRNILMFDMHHIIADGVSVSIIMKEFMMIYSGKELQELKLQYKDYSEWRNKMIGSEEIKRQEGYWINRFKDELPLQVMITDFPRPLSRTYAGDCLDFETDETLTCQIDKLISETGTTLFMVLLAAFNVLFAMHTGQEDIIVGTDFSGRTHADLQHIIGVFVNVLVMRNYPSREKTFRQFLKELKENTLDAYDNQDYQFEELVNKVGRTPGRREAGGNPLFDIAFSLVDADRRESQLDESYQIDKLKVYSYKFSDKKVKFDIGFYCRRTLNTIKISLEYSTELFKTSTAKKFRDRYIEILKQVVGEKDIQLKNIRISHERRALKSTVLQEDKGDFAFF